MLLEVITEGDETPDRGDGNPARIPRRSDHTDARFNHIVEVADQGPPTAALWIIEMEELCALRAPL